LLFFVVVVAGEDPSVFFARGFLGLGVSSPSSLSAFFVFLGVDFFFAGCLPLDFSVLAPSDCGVT
jgi:hypothetical protein